MIRKHLWCFLSGHCSISGRDWKIILVFLRWLRRCLLQFLSLSKICRYTSYSVVEILVYCTSSRRKRSASINSPGWPIWQQGNFLFLIHYDLWEGQMSPELMDFTYVFSHWSNSKLLGLFPCSWCIVLHFLNYWEVLNSVTASSPVSGMHADQMCTRQILIGKLFYNCFLLMLDF